ncbi:MAG TPA: LysR family transcriptional regulator [Candidatus Didemnitutus sp.]|nr:LysR family transcriptional regulator [Candidatus Didemnitutus sp.]
MSEKLLSAAGLSLDRLDGFLQIVDARGVSRAAAGDPNRQSQLSRQLAELEEFFGSRLVNRGRAVRFSLTDTGLRLEEIVRPTFAALHELKRGGAQNGSITIRIGAGESILSWIVVPLLPVLRQASPQASFDLLNRRSQDTLRDIASGAIDLGIIGSELQTRSLVRRTLGSFQRMLVVPSELAGDRTDVRAVLRDVPIAIMESAPGSDRSGEREFGPREATVIARCSSYVQLKAILATKSCAVILPDFMVPTDDQGIAIFRINSDRSTKPTIAVYDRTALRLRPRSLTVIETLIDMLAESMRIRGATVASQPARKPRPSVRARK